jgi:hypothetical protein
LSIKDRTENKAQPTYSFKDYKPDDKAIWEREAVYDFSKVGDGKLIGPKENDD